jgi:hypothetical protein
VTGIPALAGRLAALAGRYSEADRRRKRLLLDRLTRRPLAHPASLAEYHEALCFLQAYPDDRQILARADRALAGFWARVAALSPRRRARLADSGIAGTEVEYPFGFPMARWLVSRFGPAADVAWEAVADTDRLDEALPLLVTHLEEDGLTEGGLGLRRWLDVAKAGRAMTDLALLVELFERAPLGEEARDALWEAVALPVRWRLDGAWGSRTQAKRAWPRPYVHRRGLRRSGFDFRREVRRPLRGLRRAPRALAHSLVESARAALAARLRELHAFSHPNLADVWVADPGRGLRVALIGLDPRFRMPLEGYYAYFVLKNGVPVSYGGCWGVHGTFEFAMNVFPSFRQGESAWLTSQVLRAYRHLLGFTGLAVDRSQVGHDNLEALRSGAFYFYSRLGFRPTEGDASRLAERERARIARDPAYRSSIAVLRRLTRSEIALDLDGSAPPRIRASAIATLVTRHVAREWGGDREGALEAAASRAARLLDARGWRAWPVDERRAFRRLSLVAALMPDLARWPLADRRRLALLFRAKGGPTEVAYVRRVARHARFRRALATLAAQAAAEGGSR